MTHRSTFRGRLAGGMVAFAALMAFALPPAAADTPLPADYAGLQQRLHELGVDDATGDFLLRKLEAGHAWDSMIGAEPISAETTEVDGELVTRSVYPDGSVSLATFETPVHGGGGLVAAPGALPALAPAPGTFSKAVVGCAAIPNDGAWLRRVGCLASFDTGGFVMRFTVDYSVITGGGRIDRAYNPVVSVAAPRSLVSSNLRIGRAQSSGDLSAYAILEVNYRGSNGAQASASLKVEAWTRCWFDATQLYLA